MYMSIVGLEVPGYGRSGFNFAIRFEGFFILNDGWEYVFVLAVVGVTVATLGPGEWSVDEALGIVDTFDGYTGLAISTVGGLLAAGLALALFYRAPRTAE